MGYFLQKLAEEGGEAAKKGFKQRFGEKWDAGKRWVGEHWDKAKGKVKSYAQRAGETGVGKWVKANPWKTGIGAATTAAGIGAVLGRKKIKKALGYGDDDGE